MATEQDWHDAFNDDGSALADLRHSPRAGARAYFHLITCTACVTAGGEDAEYELLCALGRVLATDAENVVAAITAYVRLPREQRRILLEDWWKQELEDPS